MTSERRSPFRVFELLAVTGRELLELVGRMSIPLAQRIRRGNNRAPLVQLSSPLAHPTWPPPVPRALGDAVVVGWVIV